MNINIISKYWSNQFLKMRSDFSYWINNLVIQKYVYTLMVGKNIHWLNWLLDYYFKDKKFYSSLSICCGDGAHESIILKSNKVKFIHGIDISEGAINQAKKRFLEYGVNSNNYLFEVKDINKLNIKDFKMKYDLIMSIGALHHIFELENIIDIIKKILNKNGYFILVEYIGPKQFQWTDNQISIINKILKSLDPKYLNNKDVIFDKPTIEEMNKMDPSEAIRSDEIYNLIKNNFFIEYEKMYNGTIIHQLHPLLNTKLVNKNKVDFDSIINLIILMERELIKSGVLNSDFVFMILRNKY